MNIKGIDFIEFISEQEIQQTVTRLASEINREYAGKTPFFLPVLNGSFMFAADLLRQISVPCRVSFVKIVSYEGLSSTGEIRELIGLDEELRGQDVLVLEDIVDTGLTLGHMLAMLEAKGVRSVEVVSLLRKRPAREQGIAVRFTGIEIGDEFVLGYGMDYDGLGRNNRRLLKAAQ